MKIVTTKQSNYVLPKYLGGCPSGHWVLVDSQNDNRAEDFVLKICGGDVCHYAVRECHPHAVPRSRCTKHTQSLMRGSSPSSTKSPSAAVSSLSSAGGTSAELQVLQVLACLKFFLVLRSNQHLLPHQNGRRIVPCYELQRGPAPYPSEQNNVGYEKSSSPPRPFPRRISPS